MYRSILLVAVLLPSLFVTLARCQDPNPNCALIVPQNALTAQGLATPYQLTAQNSKNGPCNMANPAQQAFVQGIVLDVVSGAIFVYNPLVIDAGTQPATAPVVPLLPANAVVALWFGFNGASLRLLSSKPADSLVQANCIGGVLNGDQTDYFGQISYCNAPAFFQAAMELIAKGKLVVPPLGVAPDGRPCPTVRDFSVVDQDQSDNVVTTYILTTANTVAQNTSAARNQNPGFQEISNGSDNFLLSIYMDNALGCSPWKAPDLADTGTFKSALPLDELSAMYYQQQPIAIVPAGDPMVVSTLSGLPNIQKLNAYRVGVGQQPAISFDQADTILYCQALGTVAPAKFQAWAKFLVNGPSPDPGAANNLYSFLINRFINSWGPNGGLNCSGILNLTSPITAIMDANQIVTGGTYVAPTNLIPPAAFMPGGQFYTATSSGGGVVTVPVTPSPTGNSTVTANNTGANDLSPLLIAFIAAFCVLLVSNLVFIVVFVIKKKDGKMPWNSSGRV